MLKLRSYCRSCARPELPILEVFLVHPDDDIRAVDLCTYIFRAPSWDGLRSTVCLPIGRIRLLLRTIAPGTGHRWARNVEDG